LVYYNGNVVVVVVVQELKQDAFNALSSSFDISHKRLASCDQPICFVDIAMF
jgi:hypothetical protein